MSVLQWRFRNGCGGGSSFGFGGGSAPLSVFIAATAALLTFYYINWLCGMTRLENLTGFVHPKYQKVEKVFRKNFHDGWEREGAAIAV
ncbi:unnamed protein product [Cylicocyclus nassatus]|uniref:Uncharacterized protein n=1 Tax=Cylicocyclus nassatus TaxID=53992 RepID=A0AA36H929_CYLNA|nr:unnamed protein product [Cylicocyclus nassatus]